MDSGLEWPQGADCRQPCSLLETQRGFAAPKAAPQKTANPHFRIHA